MRIIGGNWKGKKLHPPRNLPVRPTTDRAREALCNMLLNECDPEHIRYLELFAGTGAVGMELASRGCKELTFVEQHYGAVKYIRDTFAQFPELTCKVHRGDVKSFLRKAAQSAGRQEYAAGASEKPKAGRPEIFLPYDLIFADPPYALPWLSELPEMIFASGLPAPGGWLIVEHRHNLHLPENPYFRQTRTYGESAFSWYRVEELS